MFEACLVLYIHLWTCLPSVTHPAYLPNAMYMRRGLHGCYKEADGTSMLASLLDGAVKGYTIACLASASATVSCREGPGMGKHRMLRTCHAGGTKQGAHK